MDCIWAAILPTCGYCCGLVQGRGLNAYTKVRPIEIPQKGWEEARGLQPGGISMPLPEGRLSRCEAQGPGEDGKVLDGAA
jgi:hypothetical protein